MVDANAGVVAVVVPCYRTRKHILQLLKRIGPEVANIIVVDDGCPEGTGSCVLEECHDPRVTVLVHEENQGVGGAVITGYQHALSSGADVIIKLDGDAQMDPALISKFVTPIAQGSADYVKGNRFYSIEDVRTMPRVRLLGNAWLSFLTKLSSGYWNTFDPTNGYTAISAAVLSNLPLNKLSRRYFFESDLLFRLSTVQAVVLDVPMVAVYGDEKSGLNEWRVLPQFLGGNLGNLFKRICYNYFLRGFSIASLELVAGLFLLIFGFVFGILGWIASAETGVPASTGTVMLAALPIILGVQLLLSFLAFDIAATPRRAIGPLLEVKREAPNYLAPIRADSRCSETV